MPWYWIVIIISVIVGPFETISAYNRMLKRKEQQKKALEAQQDRPKPPQDVESR